MNQIILSQPYQIGAFDLSKMDLLKNTICKGSTQQEFELFVHACKRTGLDPFMRQIYAVRYGGQMTIQTGIDGYRLIAERTGRYSPGREPTYQYDENGKLISATAYVKKQTQDGTWHEVAATAFFNEYCPKDKSGKPTRFWIQMGHNMLAKCAEALALRKAFPGDLSGLYTKEEMQQAEAEIIDDINDNTNQKTSSYVVDMPPTITKDQWIEIVRLIEKCEQEYQEKVWDFLTSQEIDSFEKMDVKLYEKIRKSCVAQIKASGKEKGK